MEVDDSSIIQFGIHRGSRMEDVPDDYLAWLWNNGFSEKTKHGGHQGAVARYIKALLPDLGKRTVMKSEKIC